MSERISVPQSPIGGVRDTEQDMSQENLERIRAVCEADAIARASGEFDPEAAISRISELWDPEIELDTSETPMLDIAGIYRGADAARQWWRDWYAAWEALRFEYELLEAGDRVVLLIDVRLRGYSSGIEVPAQFAWTSTFRDGLVVHLKLHASHPEALAAAGLSEKVRSRSPGS
jgi:SnoaL-like domain